MTTAAAQAALGPQAPIVQPERIAFADVDSGPRMIAMLGASGEVVGHYPDIDPGLGLTDLMADKLREVCDVVDQRECESLGGCNEMFENAPIGWALAGDADERTEWRHVALVQRGDRVMAVCADCSPSTLYERLWDRE